MVSRVMNPNDVAAKEENGNKKPLSLRTILRKTGGFTNNGSDIRKG
jgi:hypothetical protein